MSRSAATTHLSPARDVQQEREWVVAAAWSWIGTPYHPAARVKGAGVDCGQFLAAVYEEAGVVPRIETGEYPQDWYMHRSEERYLAFVEAHAARIPGPPEPGDIVLFNFGRCISHGAIVTEWPEIVHAYIGTGDVTLDDALANKALESRIVGFWSPWPGA